MKKSNFFALVLRMKYIKRWGLMRNSRDENLSEHSLDVAMIAHALGLIGNNMLGKNIDIEKLVTAAMYHDTSEIITGDLPTPIKYLNSELKAAYKSVESSASKRILEMLPEEIRGDYEDVLMENIGAEEKILLKSADKISALIKCIEEEKMGNTEFSTAKQSQIKSLKEMQVPEVDIFLDSFIDSCYKTLDELK